MQERSCRLTLAGIGQNSVKEAGERRNDCKFQWELLQRNRDKNVLAIKKQWCAPCDSAPVLGRHGEIVPRHSMQREAVWRCPSAQNRLHWRKPIRRFAARDVCGPTQKMNRPERPRRRGGAPTQVSSGHSMKAHFPQSQSKIFLLNRTLQIHVRICS